MIVIKSFEIDLAYTFGLHSKYYNNYSARHHIVIRFILNPSQSIKVQEGVSLGSNQQYRMG